MTHIDSFTPPDREQARYAGHKAYSLDVPGHSAFIWVSAPSQRVLTLALRGFLNVVWGRINLESWHADIDFHLPNDLHDLRTRLRELENKNG